MSQYSRDDLARCRDRIDALDLELLNLLNRRTTIVEEIGRIKQSLHLAVYEPKREDQVFANVIGQNSGPLPADAVKRIFERIIDEMRTVQQLKIIAPQGEISGPRSEISGPRSEISGPRSEISGKDEC